MPATAVHLVAPGALNCWVFVSSRVIDDGEMTGAVMVFSVTVAKEEPAAFEAVTVSFPEGGIVPGAVYRPEEVTVPATAFQLVAPGAENC